MELLKYRDLIQQSEKELEEEAILYRSEQAELSVRGAISETKKEFNEKKKELKALLKSEPFDYSEYSELEEDVKALELGLSKAQKFLKDRF